MPFRKKVSFGGRAVTIDDNPLLRKALPMQFRTPGFQTVTCPIGVDELNYHMRKFFGRLARDPTDVPLIPRA